jgi:hypothetical protein
MQGQNAPWIGCFADEGRREIAVCLSANVKKILLSGRPALVITRWRWPIRRANPVWDLFRNRLCPIFWPLAREGIGPTDKACFAGIFGFDGRLILEENARQPLFPSGSVELADVGGDQVYFKGALRRAVLEEAGIAPQMLMTEHRWRAPRVCR